MKLKAKTNIPMRGVVKILGVVVLIAVVFFLGQAVGEGRISFGKQNVVATDLPAQLNYSSVNEVYQAIRNNYDGQLTETQMLNGLKHGLADATNDPYTEYFTAAEANAFNGELNNTFSGIGAELSKDSAGDIQVIAPIVGSPAAAAGVKAGDVILTVNGKETTNMSVDDAADAIRGPAGTKVTLGILRNNSTELSLTITRQNINVPTVTSKILPGNIGYMQISTFGDDTGTLAQKYAQQFKNENVKGVILDLRDNPGGLLTQAVSVSSLWLPQNTLIMQEKRGNEVVASEYATGGDVLHGIPTVVLINAGSASSSEITTGALHDNGAAYVIGEKSFGKGVVQEIICITGAAEANGNCPADELKVTIAAWYRPDGQDIEHKGITPDQAVPLTSADISAGNDTQLTAAENYINSH